GGGGQRVGLDQPAGYRLERELARGRGDVAPEPDGAVLRADQQVELAIAIEVGQVWRAPASHVDVLELVAHQGEHRGSAAAGVAVQVDGTAGLAHHQVGEAIAVEIAHGGSG